MHKQTQTTSLLAYTQWNDLGLEATYKERCLHYLKYHEATDREAMKALSITDFSLYRPTRTRLYQAGKLEIVDERVCHESGKIAKVWRAKA